MSRATELADAITPSKDNVPELGDFLSAAAELRRLERVNAELVEALLDEAEEWSRYVVEDTAPMTLRQYLERKVAALTSATKEQQK